MDEKSIRIQEEALGKTDGPDDHVTQKGSGLEVPTDPRGDLQTESGKSVNRNEVTEGRGRKVWT